jgi:hypothetical protein
MKQTLPLNTDSMSKRRLSRWPARRTAVTTCTALIGLWLFTLMLYRRGDFALERDGESATLSKLAAILTG